MGATIENKIENKYDDFLSLLDALCCYYDRDQKEILALPISTAIRILVHDTPHSTSLLSHAGKKERKFSSTNFVNTTEPVHLGLARKINVGVTDGKGGEAKYWPLCDERYFPMPQKIEWMKFEDWWGEPVFKSMQFTLTRKDLVLSVSNKDGGAHFDAKVEKKYDEFRHSWSGGSSLRGMNSGSCRGYDNIPIYPAIRQIGYELLHTLKS